MAQASRAAWLPGQFIATNRLCPRRLALHTAAIAEKGAQEHRRHAYQLGADYTEQFYITYRMADGTLTERYYSIVYNDAELKDPDSLISRFSALYNSPV